MHLSKKIINPLRYKKRFDIMKKNKEKTSV